MALFSFRAKHPLADETELQRILAELQQADAETALDEARSWLESLVAAEDLPVDEVFERALRLDQATAAHARRLGRDYLIRPRLSRDEEYRLWHGNISYWQQLITTYEYCWRPPVSRERAIKALQSRLPQLYGQLLRAYATVIKWQQFRYKPVEGSYWQGVGQVYLAALEAGCARLPLNLQAAGSGSSTVTSSIETEYLQILMLHASSANNLLPLEIELAERMIAYLVPHVIFTRESDAANVYWVDADKPLPPTRLARLPEVTASLFFLRPGQAVEQLKRLRDRIQQTGAVPAELNLGGQYSAETLRPVLDHLILNWQPTPPMRSAPRRAVRSSLQVIHGLAAIHGQLSGLAAAATAHWQIEDVSLGGMGAQAPLGGDVQVGSLLAVQPEGGDNWLIAIVRRYLRGEDFSSVGLQTLGKNPCALQADCDGLTTEIVLLDTPKLPAPGELRLSLEAIIADGILQSRHYEPQIPLLTQLAGRRVRLRAQSLLQRGAEFVIARYLVEVLD